MPNYVDENYSENYVEGDTPSSTVTNCDLTAVNAELALIKQQNIDLNAKLDMILAKVNLNNTLSLSIADASTRIESRVDLIPTSDLDISNLATKEFITNKIPFVDDKGIKVFPNGTKVNTLGVDGFCTVISSHFLPIDEHAYAVVYTLEQISNDVSTVSNFPASTCTLYIEEGS